MWTITFGTTTGVSSTILNSVRTVLQDVADYWGRYIDFNGRTLDIRINIVNLDDTTLAQAGPETFPFSRTVGGRNVFQAGPILELQNGVDPNGASPDIGIDINLDFINSSSFFFGGLANGNVPFGQTDLFTVLAHELGHGLGFISFEPTSPSEDIAEYDLFVAGNFFTGPRSVAIFGGNVPLQSGDASHLDVNDLLFPSIGRGERLFVSALDVAILADAGLRILLPTEGNDSLFGFERDSSGGTLVGGNDVISLLGGDDTYSGLSGTDSVNGGAGRDTIFGGTGADTLRGGDGDDNLDGGTGFDSLFGDLGNDFFATGSADAYDGGAGFDAVSYTLESAAIRIVAGVGEAGAAAGANFVSIERIVGGSGADTITGLAESEFIEGGAGNDPISGAAGSDFLVGGAGSDTLDGGAGFDASDYSAQGGGANVNLVNGTAATGGALNASGGYVGGTLEDALIGIEWVIGSAFGDRLIASGASSRLEGRGGNDFLFTFGGNDTLLGGDGNDALSASLGADTLNGEAGADTLRGGDGDDNRDGGTGFDSLFGDLGNDFFLNGSSDAYDGGAGFDAVFYTLETAAIRIIAGAGEAGAAAGASFVSIERIVGGSGADTITGLGESEFIEGGAGNDQISGSAGSDFLVGGAGNDTLDGGTGFDASDYSAQGGGVNVNLVNGTAVTGGALNASGGYVGGTLEDALIGIEWVVGSNFGDRLIASGASSRLEGRGGSDFLFTFGGNDTLLGGDGNDALSASLGADTLNGGAGDDTLDGGAGNDTFEFAPGAGADRINGFTAGAGVGDVIRLAGFGAFASFADVLAAASEAGSEVLIDLGGGDSLTLAGLSLAALANDDFLFG